jgi:hypothetical protein
MGIRDFFIKQKEKKFLETTPEQLGASDIKSKIADNFVLITVAFNNSNVIKHQVALMDKNLADKFTHVIVDNSTNSKCSEAIKNICKEYGRGYVKLPVNIYGKGSESHALALNWCMKQLIHKFKPAWFGFIDHDIYPVKKEELIPILNKQKVYGLLQERDDIWYLWAGFCFFKYEENYVQNFDFRTGAIKGIKVDTGGMQYKVFYSKLDKSTLTFPTQSYENLREGEVFQSDKVEYIGNWMHSFNGSYWMEVNNKEKELELLITKYLNS